MVTTTSVAAPAEVIRPEHPLQNRNFRMWFTGGTISLLGDQFYLVALPWLVLQQTGSAIAMGTILMTAAIPRAVLMLMGGVVSDRISPRKVMIFTACARTTFVSIVGLLVWLNILRIWELYVLAGAFGTADAFDAPASQALLPFILKPEQLVSASSIAQVRTQLTGIVGPAPAGFIIKGLGLASAFFIDAFSFLFVIGALWKLPDPPRMQSANKSLLPAIMEGFQYVGRDVPLRTLMLVAMGLNFCLGGPASVGLAYMAKTKFGSPAMLGMMFSCFAGGTLVGALLGGIWKIRRRGIMLIVVAFILSLLLGSLGMLNSRWIIAVVLAAMGITAGMANVHISAWIMQRMDAAVRGRVSSVLMLGTIGTIPISLALAGLLIAVSMKLMFLLAGSVMLLVTLIAASHKPVRDIQ